MSKLRIVLLLFCASAGYSQGKLQNPPAAASPNLSSTDYQIQTQQNRVKQSSRDYSAYDGLGSAFFQKARETGDIAFYDLAEQTLKKALDLVPRDFRAADPLVHLALVDMGEHRFQDALANSQTAIRFGSGNLAAFAIEGDAYTDMGDYDQAAAAYRVVQTLSHAVSAPGGLAYMTDSRIAYLRFLHGDSAGAIELMKSAILSALQTDMPRENLAWLYFELGERFFQTGDLANAALSYQAGIHSDPAHYRCLGGLAKVRAAEGRFDEAIALYQQSITILPFPVYIEELGDVLRKLGREKEAQQQYDLVEYIGHLSTLNRVLANRELALFYADHEIKLPEALELARKEFEVRHDIYTWDTMAWVLYKNGRMQDAADAMNHALSLHTNDPVLLFHAGMIDHSLAKEEEAEDLLRYALQTNDHFHLFDAETASRTLAEIAKTRTRDLRSSNAR